METLMEKRNLSISKSAIRFLLAVSLISIFNTAKAQWNGAVGGRINQIDALADLYNFPFRVTLQGNPVMCQAGHTWAYLDGSALNYKIVASVLMMAKARNAQVTIYTKHDASGQNYCRIDYVTTLD
jgi:hypothetical protein